MGQWTILERLLEASVHQHSTMIGRILLTVVGIFRILMVAIVGETVYEDEQSMFMCDTLQPGCNQACYDTTFPISHIRFWVFQIIMVCCPSLCFITYSVHQASKHRDRVCLGLDEDQNLDRSRKTNGILQHKGEEPDCTEVGGPRFRSKLRRQEGISRFYILQVVFRNLVEASFLLGQYVLFGWSVPAVLACGRYPCVKEVECYVSRPTEKTAFLLFMFAVSGFCVLLNLAELNHLGWTKVRAAIRGVRDRRRSLYEIRNKDPPTMSGNHYGHSRSSMNQFGQNRSRDSVYV